MPPSLPLPDGPVQVVFFDIDGVPRGKWLHRDKLSSALGRGGLGFCNVVFGWDCADVPYDNATLSGWHTGYPDAALSVDPHTYRTVPWMSGMPLFVGDFSTGALAGACPRSLLKRVLAKAASMDLTVRAAVEYEWFNFRETPGSLAAKLSAGEPIAPLTPGMHGYSLLRPRAEQDLYSAFWRQLTDFGIPVEGLHTETGPGVYEVASTYTDALAAADHAALTKLAVKHVGLGHGVIASFMAKWSAGLPGCGGHVHQSLARASDGAPVGFDESRPYALSPTFAHYLAGQLEALPRLLPLFAPNVNSYKRLVRGSWAATAVGWGIDNRTAALRLIGDDPGSFRIEHRVPGADANPYLALAAMVAAGLDGIERELPLAHAPIVGSAYGRDELEPLPTTLAEANARMREHTAYATRLLGEGFVEHFLATRDWEARQAPAETDGRDQISTWELQRYLEII